MPAIPITISPSEQVSSELGIKLLLKRKIVKKLSRDDLGGVGAVIPSFV